MSCQFLKDVCSGKRKAANPTQRSKNMNKHPLFRKALSFALVLCMLISFAVPAMAADNESIGFEQIDNSAIKGSPIQRKTVQTTAPVQQFDSKDTVRVSIVLEGDSVIEAGYSTSDILNNASALKYLENIKSNQKSMEKKISKAIGKNLNVQWNLGLAANIISANIVYGDLDTIASVSGVDEVVVETQYNPCGTVSSADPNMAISAGNMTGAAQAWAEGYTGAGSRIAIIDTGLDIDHQSFDNDAFLYALKQDAAAAGKKWLPYVTTLDLLNARKVSLALKYLNAAALYGSDLTAEDLVISDKIPFAFNYVDINTDVTHLHDTAGEHGSHVAGIAAANRYIKTEDGYVDAIASVCVAGNAPDAQVLVMKVFGQNGGAYDSDYMAAIEDAILLGCDSVNLSLGSGFAGMTTSTLYQDVMDRLSNTNTVVVMSGGNNGAWADETKSGNLYSDDVNFQTGGSPGSYPNGLTVASVNNDGVVGYSFQVNGKSYSYTESTEGANGNKYTNLPLTTLASDDAYEYVFVEGIGEEADYEGIDLTGKVVFCSRGAITFSEKANIAASKGAAAVIVYNNLTGVFAMDLSNYAYTAPCVSITQDVAAAILDASTPATSDVGSEYFTGSVVISDEIAPLPENAERYTMSSFSSWGVPGDLSLKPEITAPGGNVYSVAGTYNTGSSLAGGTDQYELMSGTSMAAPQITGMTAVLKRYIEQNRLTIRKLPSGILGLLGGTSGISSLYTAANAGLSGSLDLSRLSKYGLTDRALAQSLLMSTATPMVAPGGYIYSPMQQGAGLANVSDAMNAATYILMGSDATASAADGKVKAELGDDPKKTGVYSFSFTMTNIAKRSETYKLSADVFTQDTNGALLYGSTAPIDAKISFKVNGRTASSVTVGRGKTAVVNVTIALTDETKAYLDEYYADGAYVEAYVYAKPTGESSAHSIPVLAYYGNWTDPSMLDKGSYLEYLYGTETRLPYLVNENYVYGNAYSISFAGDSGEYFFGGNLYANEKDYDPARNAMNNQKGDYINAVYYTLIRNAGIRSMTITDAETGKTYLGGTLDAQYAAYYYTKSESWKNTQFSIGLNWAGTDASGNPLPEGTTVNLTFTAAPEYYRTADGTYDLSGLGEGAYFTTQLTIDNTAPVVTAVSDESGSIAVAVSDNENVAAILLYAEDGEELLATYSVGAPSATGLLATEMDADVYLIQVIDYAGNISTYRLFLNIEPTNEVESVSISEDTLYLVKNNTAKLTAQANPKTLADRSVTWSSDDVSVATVNENGIVTALGEGTCVITAAATANPEMVAKCQVTVVEISTDLNGFVWDENGEVWFSQFNTADLPNYTKLTETSSELPLNAMAYGADGTLFACDLDTSEGFSTLYTVDPATFAVTPVGASSIAYTDLASAPHLGGYLLATYSSYILMVDPSTGEYAGVLPWCSNNLVGITYAGSMMNKNYGAYMDCYYLLDAKGNLYREAFIELDGEYFNFFGEENGLLIATGITCDTPYFQSLYFDGEYTYASCFNQSKNAVTLYAIDSEVSGSVFKLGSFADGVWPVGGLIELQPSGESAVAARFAELANAQAAVEMTSVTLQPMTMTLSK